MMEDTQMLKGKAREEEFLALKKIVDKPDFKTAADVESFFIALTKYIWDHKMIGKIYDHYTDETIIHGENGSKMSDVSLVMKHTSEALVSIPDIQTTFLEIYAVKITDDEYKFIQVTHLDATFTGPCRYGPPGRQKRAYENDMCMCECHVKKIKGQWKIVEEWCLGFDDFYKTLFA
jgi:hypothetical protein